MQIHNGLLRPVLSFLASGTDMPKSARGEAASSLIPGETYALASQDILATGPTPEVLGPVRLGG